MKKLYSIILMVSFLVGALQPVLPMIEYHLFEGDVISFFYSNGNETTEEEAMCIAVEIPAPLQQQDEDRDLLDTEFYPIPVKSCEENGTTILPLQGESYAFEIDQMITHFRDPSSPPPKDQWILTV